MPLAKLTVSIFSLGGVESLYGGMIIPIQREGIDTMLDKVLLLCLLLRRNKYWQKKTAKYAENAFSQTSHLARHMRRHTKPF